MIIMTIEEEYLIVDRLGTTYIGEFGHVIKPPVSVHVSRWYVMDCPVQWDVVMDILRVLLGLVNSYGGHEALPISLGKYK